MRPPAPAVDTPDALEEVSCPFPHPRYPPRGVPLRTRSQSHPPCRHDVTPLVTNEPSHRKLVAGLLICSGFFVIAAAIIRVVLTLGARPSGTNINRWGVRETIVGIVSVNVPILRPMFTAAFWSGRGPASSALSSAFRPRGDRSRTLPAAAGPYEMADGDGKGSLGADASRDCILSPAKPLGNDIYVETVYHIQTGDARRGLGTEGWATGGWSSRTDIHSPSDVV